MSPSADLPLADARPVGRRAFVGAGVLASLTLACADATAPVAQLADLADLADPAQPAQPAQPGRARVRYRTERTQLEREVPLQVVAESDRPAARLTGDVCG